MIQVVVQIGRIACLVIGAIGLLIAGVGVAKKRPGMYITGGVLWFAGFGLFATTG